MNTFSKLTFLLNPKKISFLQIMHFQIQYCPCFRYVVRMFWVYNTSCNNIFWFRLSCWTECKGIFVLFDCCNYLQYLFFTINYRFPTQFFFFSCFLCSTNIFHVRTNCSSQLCCHCPFFNGVVILRYTNCPIFCLGISIYTSTQRKYNLFKKYENSLWLFCARYIDIMVVKLLRAFQIYWFKLLMHISGQDCCICFFLCVCQQNLKTLMRRFIENRGQSLYRELHMQIK